MYVGSPCPWISPGGEIHEKFHAARRGVDLPDCTSFRRRGVVHEVFERLILGRRVAMLDVVVARVRDPPTGDQVHPGPSRKTSGESYFRGAWAQCQAPRSVAGPCRSWSPSRSRRPPRSTSRPRASRPPATGRRGQFEADRRGAGWRRPWRRWRPPPGEAREMGLFAGNRAVGVTGTNPVQVGAGRNDCDPRNEEKGPRHGSALPSLPWVVGWCLRCNDLVVARGGRVDFAPYAREPSGYAEAGVGFISKSVGDRARSPAAS